MTLDLACGSLGRLRRLQLLCSRAADDRRPDALLFIAGIDSRNNAGSQVRSNKLDRPELLRLLDGMLCSVAVAALLIRALSNPRFAYDFISTAGVQVPVPERLRERPAKS